MTSFYYYKTSVIIHIDLKLACFYVCFRFISLLASYLASKADLSPFLAPDSASAGLEDNLSQLHKLHVLLDLVILLQTYLSPSQECLREIVHQALQELSRSRQDLPDLEISKGGGKNIEFKIQIGHVKEKMEK